LTLLGNTCRFSFIGPGPSVGGSAADHEWSPNEKVDSRSVESLRARSPDGALQNDADALRAARDFERASKISFDLARQQMQTGYANVLILLTAQQTYLQAVIQVVQARAARLSDTAALFQALGGGWWNRPAPPAEKILNVGTGQALPVTEKDKDGGFLRGLWPFTD